MPAYGLGRWDYVGQSASLAHESISQLGRDMALLLDELLHQVSQILEKGDRQRHAASTRRKDSEINAYPQQEVKSASTLLQ